jgi:uncharacterized membrane protein (UPF0127 family)
MARLIDKENGLVIVETLRVARGIRERMRGLLGRDRLPPGEGLLIERCSSIHTFFMRFPLDVMFLDRELRVTKVLRNLGPWRLAGAPGSACVVETAAGALDGLDLHPRRALALEGTA